MSRVTYRMRLDGTVSGKFGGAGRLLKEFGAVNSIDCRSENTLFAGVAARETLTIGRSPRHRRRGTVTAAS